MGGNSCRPSELYFGFRRTRFSTVPLKYLKLNGLFVCFDRHVKFALLVIDGGQVSVDDGVRGVDTEGLLVRLNRAVENACLLEHVAEVDVGVEEVTVELDRLVKVVNREPDVATLVIDAAEVGEGDGEVGVTLDRLQVTLLTRTLLTHNR